MSADGILECTRYFPEGDQSSSNKPISGFRTQICYSPWCNEQSHLLSLLPSVCAVYSFLSSLAGFFRYLTLA